MEKLGFLWVSKCDLGNISGFLVGFQWIFSGFSVGFHKFFSGFSVEFQ